MKKVFVFLLLVNGLFATEIVVDGKYSSLLGNPYKAKLEVKSSDLSIISGSSNIINAVVTTNKNDFGSIYRQPEFTIAASSCNKVLKNFMAEDYNIVSTSENSATCEIESLKVNLTYAFNNDSHLNVISTIEVETGIVIKIVKNGVIKEVRTSDKLDQTLGRDGKNYMNSIRTDMKLDSKSTEENIQMILENSIYRMLNNTKG
ncbi:hypothetical protein FA592_03605 [Sulfurospirillum diekertiae]|uniref:Uncharacterized protein n=1 Tax=Sulfurospirillum diekertiae TaxID=1854492 RepID=A0A6G9VRI3_9BACT|nr:hypothetical protein [Sulfurospirillum diekertiae]QIR75361.1 hypothetical protein FA584_03700 [Sulfurospirillum diekertiae]QIR78010.1 hypothetical protein FA592_03605 [Sulfurospirillum diekertiae]